MGFWVPNPRNTNVFGDLQDLNVKLAAARGGRLLKTRACAFLLVLSVFVRRSALRTPVMELRVPQPFRKPSSQEVVVSLAAPEDSHPWAFGFFTTFHLAQKLGLSGEKSPSCYPIERPKKLQTPILCGSMSVVFISHRVSV